MSSPEILEAKLKVALLTLIVVTELLEHALPLLGEINQEPGRQCLEKARTAIRMLQS